MGMFDYVNVEEIDCPKCGTKVGDWQSKDAHCVMGMLDPIVVDNFYTVCDGCNAWIWFNREITPRTPHRQQPFTVAEVQKLGFTLHVTELGQ